MNLRFPLPISILLAASALSDAAQAGFTNAYVPPYRGTPGTEFGSWESFTVPFGGTNLPDVPGSTTVDATLEQLIPGAVITGTGNLYHPTAAPSFRVADSGPSDLQEVALQIATEGSELDYASPVLHFLDGQGQPQAITFTTYSERARYAGVGINVESLYTWDLAAVPDLVSSYTITFQGAVEHLSLNAMMVDTRYGSSDGLFVPYCYPGADGVIACPCGNPPSDTGRGCNNFGALSGGARLSGAGSASISADTFVLTASAENNTALSIFLQSPASNASGLVFGAGVRCVTGSLKRLYSGIASGGAISRPGPGDPSITARSAALGAPIQAGNARYYLTYYRDPQAVGPCGSSSQSFNATQSGRLVWLP